MASHISLYKLITGKHRNALFVNTIDMMNIISQHLEDVVLNKKLAVDFYAGFQRYSYLQKQADRYSKLAQVARSVHVFGVPDNVEASQISGLKLIPLQTQDALAEEWFLVINAPYFYTALLTREVKSSVTGERRFEGIWTYDENVVSQADLLLHQYCGKEYTPIRHRDYQRHNEYITDIANSLATRLDLTHIADKQNQRFSRAVNGLARSIEDDHSLADLLHASTASLLSNFGAHTVTTWQFDDSTNQMELVTAAGLPANWEQQGQHRMSVQQSDFLAAKAVNSHKVEYVPNTRASQIQDLIDPEAQSIAAIPLHACGQTVGAIQVTNHRPFAYNSDMLNALRSLGSYLGMAMLNASREPTFDFMDDWDDDSTDETAWTILDNTPDGMIVLNADKTLHFVNNTARRLFDVEGYALNGENIVTLKSADLTRLVASISPTSLPTGGQVNTNQGQALAVLSISPIYDDLNPLPENGHNHNYPNVKYWTLILRDVTIQTNQTIDTSHLNNITSDLKHRLQSMQDLLSLLPSLGELSPPQMQALERIKTLGNELHLSLNDLKKLPSADPQSETLAESPPAPPPVATQTKPLTRSEQLDQLQAQPSPHTVVNLREMLEAVVAQFTPTAEAKDLKIVLELPTDLDTIQGNQAELSLALSELMDNAIKYSPGSGQVRVIAGLTGKNIILAVRDNGKGIWLKDIPSLFEPGYRVDNAQTQAIPGEGLGLALVQAVAHNHQGRALVESRVGRGSVFLIKLPL